MLISQSNNTILKTPVSSESIENSINNVVVSDIKTRLEENEELPNNNLLVISAVRFKYSTENAENKICDHQYVKIKPNRTTSKLENQLQLSFPTKIQNNISFDDSKSGHVSLQQDPNSDTGCKEKSGFQPSFGSGKGPPIPDCIPSGSTDTTNMSESADSSKKIPLSIKETLNEIKGSLGLVLRAKNKGLTKFNKNNVCRSGSFTESVFYKKNEACSIEKPTSEISRHRSGNTDLDISDIDIKNSSCHKENTAECSKLNNSDKFSLNIHHGIINDENVLATKNSSFTEFRLDQVDVDLPSGFHEEERISTATSPLSLDDSSIQGRELPASNGDEETESEEGVKLWLDETSSDTNEFGKHDPLEISITDFSVPSTSGNSVFPSKEIKSEMSPHEDFNNDAPPPLIPLVEPCILDAPVSPEMPVLTPVLDTREISIEECFFEKQDKIKKELFPPVVENLVELNLGTLSPVLQSCRHPKVPQVLLEPLSVQLLEKHKPYVSLTSSSNLSCDSRTAFCPNIPLHKSKTTVDKHCHPSKDNPVSVQRQSRLRSSGQNKFRNKRVSKEKEKKDHLQNGVLTRKKFRELSLKSANDNNRTKYLENAAQSEKNSEVDMIVIDGIEFFSFETEEALKEYTRQDQNKKSSLSINDDSDSSWPKDFAETDAKDLNCERPIIPTKTNDITKIKGWRNKVFASETTPMNPSPIHESKKLSWTRRIQIRRQLARMDRKKTGLLALMKRRRLHIRTRRFNKKVRTGKNKSLRTQYLLNNNNSLNKTSSCNSENEKQIINNSSCKVTTDKKDMIQDIKNKESSKSDEDKHEMGQNMKDRDSIAEVENQAKPVLISTQENAEDGKDVLPSEGVPKYRFINEKREIQIETNVKNVGSSDENRTFAKPIPNFMKAFKTKYGWFQKIGNALIPVGEVNDDIPRYIPALSKTVNRPPSLELVTLKTEDAEFAASALYCPDDDSKKSSPHVQLTNISLEMARLAVTAVMNYPIEKIKSSKQDLKKPIKSSVKIKEEPPSENEDKISTKTRISNSSPSSGRSSQNKVKEESVEPEKIKSSSKCGKSFCSFGCVCDSLKTRRRGRRHCGKVDCMFSCVCNQNNSDVQIESRSENCKTKSIIMTDEGPVKRRRATRLPARLLDSAFLWNKGKELLIDPDLDVSYRNKRVKLENKSLKSKSAESIIYDKSKSYLAKRHVSARHSQREMLRMKTHKMKFKELNNEKCKPPKVPPLKITNLLAKSGFPASVQEWTVVSNSEKTTKSDVIETCPNSQLYQKAIQSENQSNLNQKQANYQNLGNYSERKQSPVQLLNEKQDGIKIIGNTFKFANDHTVLGNTPDFETKDKTDSCRIEHTTGYLVPKSLIKNSSLKSILTSPQSIPVRVLKSQFTSQKSHSDSGNPIIGIYSIRGVSSHAFVGPIPYKIVAKSNLQTIDGHRLLKKPTEIIGGSPYKNPDPKDLENRTSSSFQLQSYSVRDSESEKQSDISTRTWDSKLKWKLYSDDDDVITCLDDIIKQLESSVKTICCISELQPKSLQEGFTQVFIQGSKILQKLPNGNITKFNTTKRKETDPNTTKPLEIPRKKLSLDASICKPFSVVLTRTKCDPDKTVLLSKDFNTVKSAQNENSKTKEKNNVRPRLLSAEVAPLAWNRNHEPALPKIKKERQRRHEIFQCFVRLCAVLDPTAVSSWKKNYEKIPSKVIILKKAKQCIRDLELYSCNIRKFKKALIKRRNSLFNHYSQLLKVLPTDVQKKTVLKLTKSLKQCCAVRKNRSQTQTTWEPDLDHFLRLQYKSRFSSAREVVEISSDEDDDNDDEDDEDDDNEDDDPVVESDENSSGGHSSRAETEAVDFVHGETWQSDENDLTNSILAVPNRTASELAGSNKTTEMTCEAYTLINETMGNTSTNVVTDDDSTQRMFKSRLKRFSSVNSQLVKRLHHSSSHLSDMTKSINSIHNLRNSCNISFSDTTQNSLAVSAPYTIYPSDNHLLCDESSENQTMKFKTCEGDKLPQHFQEMLPNLETQMISQENSEVYLDSSEQLYIRRYSSNSETTESSNVDVLSNGIPPGEISEGPNVIIVGKPQIIPASSTDGNAQNEIIISDSGYIVANYNDLGALTALQNKTEDSSVPDMEISHKVTSHIDNYGDAVAEYVVMEGPVLQNTDGMEMDRFSMDSGFGKEILDERSKSKEVISEHFEDIILPNDDSVSDEISIELPKIIACSSITEAEFLAEDC